MTTCSNKTNKNDSLFTKLSHLKWSWNYLCSSSFFFSGTCESIYDYDTINSILRQTEKKCFSVLTLLMSFCGWIELVCDVYRFARIFVCFSIHWLCYLNYRFVVLLKLKLYFHVNERATSIIDLAINCLLMARNDCYS